MQVVQLRNAGCTTEYEFTLLHAYDRATQTIDVPYANASVIKQVAQAMAEAGLVSIGGTIDLKSKATNMVYSYQVRLGC